MCVCVWDSLWSDICDEDDDDDDDYDCVWLGVITMVGDITRESTARDIVKNLGGKVMMMMMMMMIVMMMLGIHYVIDF